MLLITTFFTLCLTRPNPVTDNESDESFETNNYFYKFTKSNPYWQAFPSHLKTNLEKHDYLEFALKNIRDLDFKFRETWTVTEEPYSEY